MPYITFLRGMAALDHIITPISRGGSNRASNIYSDTIIMLVLVQENFCFHATWLKLAQMYHACTVKVKKVSKEVLHGG